MAKSREVEAVKPLVDLLSALLAVIPEDRAELRIWLTHRRSYLTFMELPEYRYEEIRAIWSRLREADGSAAWHHMAKGVWDGFFFGGKERAQSQGPVH